MSPKASSAPSPITNAESATMAASTEETYGPLSPITLEYAELADTYERCEAEVKNLQRLLEARRGGKAPWW